MEQTTTALGMESHTILYLSWNLKPCLCEEGMLVSLAALAGRFPMWEVNAGWYFQAEIRFSALIIPLWVPVIF